MKKYAWEKRLEDRTMTRSEYERLHAEIASWCHVSYATQSQREEALALADFQRKVRKVDVDPLIRMKHTRKLRSKTVTVVYGDA